MKNSTNESNFTMLNPLNGPLSSFPPPHEPNNNTTDASKQSETQYEIKIMRGFMTNCNFYISDVTGDISAISFRMAYKAAKDSKTNKELCACVGSMICSLVPGLRNSIEKALNLISIRPCFVSLPSQAQENKIVDSALPPLDWPSILVIFGYCILLLFKLKFNVSIGYQAHILNCIRELQAKVKWDPSNTLQIPFDVTKANTVTAMLGSPKLQETVKKFLMSNFNHTDSQVCNLCKYLSITLP